VITQWDGQPIDTVLKNILLQYANSGTAAGLLNIQLSLVSRGMLGSTVQITYQNPGGAVATTTLTRDTPQRVDSNKTPINAPNNKLPSGIGYIRINNFEDGGITNIVDPEIDQLIKDNVPAIILDVRTNPGGFSQVSDAITGRFFDKPYLVGKELSSKGEVVELEEANPRPPIYKGCVMVLVDVTTSSSGDIFAYTFKASQRGLIIGHTASAGMAGTVSGGMYTLPNNGYIQVPTGGLVDQNGKYIIEGVGAVPDITVPQTIQSLVSPDDDVLAAAQSAVASCKPPQ
jgi:C-terminal processing protease CtpA/Prc